MKCGVELSRRAERDLDFLDGASRQRILRRLDQLTDSPYDSRLSGQLSGMDNLRKSRVGAWRIIYRLNAENTILFVVTIDRRDQVYKRL